MTVKLTVRHEPGAGSRLVAADETERHEARNDCTGGGKRGPSRDRQAFATSECATAMAG